MQRPIIASVDGSDRDARTMAFATAIAKVADADLRLFRAIAPPSPRLIAQAATIGLDDAAVSGRREVEAQLAHVAAGVAVAPERHADVDVVEADDAGAAIIDEAVRHDALLVVMATRAPGPVARAIAGSVTDRVMRESPLPVVVVPPGADFMAGRHVELTRVLVPQDGSSLAFRCIEFLIALPNAEDLSYVLIEVLGTEQDRPSVEMRMESTATWLRSRGARSVEVLVAEPNDPAEAIVDAVRDVMPEMIAMSTRGSSGLGRLVLGSVAEGVVRRSELPVLLLTPQMLARRPESKSPPETSP